MYVPFRVHGHHSLLTGVDSPAALLERASELGLPALALCDVDSLGGLVDFLRAADRQRVEHPERAVRPIVGAELSDPTGATGRLIALVRSETGYRNLCRLITARHLGDDLGAGGARMDGDARGEGPASFQLAASAVRYQEGLFLLADHPRLLLALFGRVPARALFAAISPASLALVKSARSSAGNGRTRNAHLEAPVRAAPVALAQRAQEEPLEEPKTPPPSQPVSALELVEAARALGVATLAVPDVYSASPGGRHDHCVRVAIKHNALLQDLSPEWLAAQPAHLPSPAEMRALYAELPDVPGPWTAPAQRELPGALARTLAVAQECGWRPELDRVFFPEVSLGEGETAYSRLAALAFAGASQRYQPLRPEVVRRLDYELGAIESLGFAPYFLLVKEIADFARERAIPCVGRGSAADSLVSYCLELTDADPLRYRLPFERFLNPSRKDRPDIDLDFCWRRRDEVLAHVYAAFGAERTAMICTLNCFGLRAAFREAALALGLPPAEINRWSRRLPWHPPSLAEWQANAVRETAGLSQEWIANPIARAFLTVPECRGFPFDDARYQSALRAAAGLLDTPRHFGLHPGGVVVAPGRVTDFIACQRAAKGVVVTQLDKDAIEAVGLVKMDLLGNRALTVIDDTLKALREREPQRQPGLDLTRIPEDDEATAQLLREGRTLGCFQVESPGMRHLLQQTGAWRMDDVIQAVALIRPGPASSGMKDAYVRRFRGLEPPRAPHPRLTELLWDTHGVMLYQEDVMQVVSVLAGMDLAEADILRRTLQKRRGPRLEEMRRRFLAACAANDVERVDAERVWELIANFASFGFCKAHAVTYGRIAYRAVYLKAHHPAVYLAAFLASETGYYDRRVYVEEARRLGVPILGPDVNQSARSFGIEWVERAAPGSATLGSATPCLRVGLGQVKGLTQGTLEAILERREREGPFLSLPDFLERTRARTDETAHLIQCGAFDAFDRTRPEMLWRLHLLSAPARRAPQAAPREEALDLGELAACRATPRSRANAALAAARTGTGGWSQHGLGLGQAALAPGESARLFPEPETPAVVLPGLPDLEPTERGLLEYELLGLTIAAHPSRLFPCAAEERLAAAPLAARPPPLVPCAEIARLQRGRVTLRGWLAASRRVRTVKGEWMRFLTLEDESGIAEVVVFSAVYHRDGHLLVDQGPFLITGRVEDQLGARTLHAERIW
jgi:DNA polymerase III subunit alpha